MKKYIIIIIILILIIFILWFLFARNQQPIINNQLPTTNELATNQQIDNQQINTPLELTPEQKAEIEKKELIVKARNFIERYGSFSSDAQFANLYELKNEMTSRFWQETEKSLSSEALAKEDFYSISTKVLNITEKIFLSDSITYSISTQREETKNITEKILYQTAELKMVKQQGSWLVDSVSWK
jgi:hypothetical protein